MKKAIFPLIIAGTLAGTGAYAADEDEKAGETVENNLEAKLDAARERLEEAAHEVAELSAEIGRPVIERFREFGEGPQRAVIGVQLDPQSGKDGARIRDVSPGGPAAQAGIQAKDVIVKVNETDVKGDSAREVARIMRDVDPEEKVNVRVLRDGKPKDFVVTTRPVVFPMFSVEVPPIPPVPPVPPHSPMSFDRNVLFMRPFGGDYADMELATLTPQLGSYFGTSEGVLVVRAPDEDDLKLQDGDVILSIDGRKPTNGSHATRILRSYQPGEKVVMRVMRQKKAVDLNVTLPKRTNEMARAFHTEEPDE